MPKSLILLLMDILTPIYALTSCGSIGLMKSQVSVTNPAQTGTQ